MFEALVLGAVARASLLLSGLIATWVTVPSRVTGWLAGFGAGALISAGAGPSCVACGARWWSRVGWPRASGS